MSPQDDIAALQDEIARLRAELARRHTPVPPDTGCDPCPHRQGIALLHAIFNSLPFACWTMDADHRLTMQNRHAIAMWGDHLGQRIPDMGLPADLVEEFARRKTRVFAGEVIELDESLLLPDGRKRRSLTVAAPVWLDGVVTAMVGINVDTTAQHQLEDQLRQAQKLETVGRLAGGVAHDFNNLLAGILGYAELLERRLGDERARQHAHAITEAANRAADLTRQLLVFSRKSSRSCVPTDLHGVINAVIGILEHTFDRSITIGRRLQAPEPVVAGDASQLQSVLLNLAVNARDAMPNGGALIIGTDEVMLDPHQIAGLNAGRHVRITVTDTGSGMDAAVLEHIFEPFFTTKPTGLGTGLGLAAVYGIMRDHGGAVAVTSTPGSGTTFTLHLPCVRDAVPASASPAPQPGTGRILLVDDEPLLRALGTEQLMALGYDVVCARDGQEAIDIVRSSTLPFRAVIMDVIMPRLGGGEALRQIRILAPDLPVVMASGFGADQDHLLREGAVAFVPKPFTATIMSQVLGKVLGNG